MNRFFRGYDTLTLDIMLNLAIAVIVIAIPLTYWVRYRSKVVAAEARLKFSYESGLTEPVSLHPKIDPNSCISTGACVSACPEGEILGIVNARAQLVSPTRCIGHGACMTACPTNAISLVFGTERRGVELPHVTETFETNVPGIYIAGELGGMGLIRNAVTQGKEAVEYIAKERQHSDDCEHDLLIIGAGPAGVAASLQAKEEGLRVVALEQEQNFGGAILSYPRQKLVMTQPMEIPTFGKFNKREIVKEELMELFEDLTSRAGVEIKLGSKVESVTPQNGHFQITSTDSIYRARSVLLAIGRRGTPRKLGVPGEASSKVAYRLLEPGQYRNKSILVVGGGDSAIEAALALSEQHGTRVSLSYRKNVFSRIKEKNGTRIQSAFESGAIAPLMESNVVEIRPKEVVLEQMGREVRIDNDFTFVLIGGELPVAFLKSIGIAMETKYGVR